MLFFKESPKLSKKKKSLYSRRLRPQSTISEFTSFFSDCISLLPPRLPALPNQSFSNGPGNLGNVNTNNEIQPLTIYTGDGRFVITISFK